MSSTADHHARGLEHPPAPEGTGRMSTSAAHHPSVRTPSGLFAFASFAIMVGGWAAFALALLVSQHTLDDVWVSVRELPLLVEVLVWLLAFPFLVGLAIWEASWDEGTRLIAITVLAVVYTCMFVPRARER